MTTVHGGLRDCRAQKGVVTSATMRASKEQRRLRNDVMMYDSLNSPVDFGSRVSGWQYQPAITIGNYNNLQDN